jgi:hypothetical protein
MSKHHTHASHCRCPRCTPRHPAAPRLTPLQRAIGVIAAGTALTCLVAQVVDRLSFWS